ncbi:hypothetical protein BJX61DRAFT_24291 [Aspergillus egyptiacus]|nr:hypothetical protein BJX61DRAFT_24291 [Aspergillus egyptiacus]
MDFAQHTSDGSQSSSSELSHSDLSSAVSEIEDPLEQLAKRADQISFTTDASLRQTLEHHQHMLQQDKIRDQYLVFTSVPLTQSSELSDDQSRTSKYCRFSFNLKTGTLIAKLMPGPAHELAGRSFDLLISQELCAMNIDCEVWPFGSTTVTLGNWKKEADCCWAPGSTVERLSFVVEVGLSESARHLALDAHGWLETNASPVNLVVTIGIRREYPEIIFRRWELLHGPGTPTRSSTPSTSCTAFIKLSRIDSTTSVTGECYVNGTLMNTTQLDLPFDKIVNRPPRQPLEKDLVIPEQKLRYFAERIWNVQGLL